MVPAPPASPAPSGAGSGSELPRDRHARPLGSLRVSVTDRCNLRCRYCMPEETYTWLEREHLLTFEEFERLARVFARLGVRKLRLTGGEPLLRRNLPALVARLAAVEGIEDLALTTNATRLAGLAGDLREAGLSRLTISLDTLDPARYRELTGRDELGAALAGIEAAVAAGFRRTKLNTVVMRGVNDDELLPILAFAREHGVQARFIEYMDVGGATRWTMDHVLPKAEILRRIEEAEGPIELAPTAPDAPARNYRLADGTKFGVIASTTEPFCGTCDRARLTADGHLLLCLYASEGIDLRDLLRSDATDEDLHARLASIWSARADQGATDRLSDDRAPLGPDELRGKPHLEMHTRGG